VQPKILEVLASLQVVLPPASFHTHLDEACQVPFLAFLALQAFLGLLAFQGMPRRQEACPACLAFLACLAYLASRHRLKAHQHIVHRAFLEPSQEAFPKALPHSHPKAARAHSSCWP